VKYIDELNSEQKKAVLHRDGPLLIVAGAGAGKTKTVTHRILHLIREGVAPENILAITFTNKAAKEMSERVSKLLDSDPDISRSVVGFENKPFVSTFHALGVHILKENSALLGIPRHFAIFDKSDSLRAIKEAMQTLNIDTKAFEPSRMQNIISREKGNAVTYMSYKERLRNEYIPKVIASVWEKYEEILKSEKALDFDDLLLKSAMLLKNNPDILEKYQNKWKYIHIDEYQDTNKVQYATAKLLAKKFRNICVVGDSDQSIYGWRGADIKNILDFEKDYPDAKVILLEENYRSTQNILEAANRIIQKNKLRTPKKLFTKNVAGEKIGLCGAYDEVDEARFVAKKSRQLIEDSGVSPRSIAVLYRANFQGRALEEAFMAESISYQVLGTKFFERKEIKDIVSYLRAAMDPTILSDIKRVINIPARGLGKVTLVKLFSGKKDELPVAAQKKIDGFYLILKRIAEKAAVEKLSETIKFILAESGIETALRQGGAEDQERLENVREMVTFATKYDVLPIDEGMEKFLSDVALASDQDELMKNHDAVKLMTVHASKGLEFDYVFVTGLEEDLFPHKRMGVEKVSDEDSEEERRLFYVAITRAKKKLYISYAGVRTIFGSRQVTMPSQFVYDIEEDIIEKEEQFEGGGKIIYLD
jgi:DNA helicase-2/ATP-dependent DNA helicase PcrA